MNRDRAWSRGRLQPAGFKYRIAHYVVLAALFSMLLCQPVSEVFADSAVVLPKGVWRIDTKFQKYSNITKRYDPDGNKEDMAVDYNTSLNSTFLPALELVELGFGLDSGSASLGDSIVDIDYDPKILQFEIAYGLTKKVSLGIKIPYWWFKSNVRAKVDSGAGSSATVGLNSFWGTAGDPYGSPVVPLGLPGATPTTTEDVQQILGPGLEINGTPAIPGYGYDRFKSWSGKGIADIEAGARYQYFKNERWQHAFTGAVRFPTGRKDDPDNLTDFAFGQNSYALLFRSNHDFLGYKDWLFNVTLKYDWVLPKKETRRIPDAVDTPITSNKEKVDIDIGNRVELDLTARYSFSPEWSVAARYRASKKWKDEVDGDMGFEYSSLEDETDRTSQIYQLYLIYSWLDKYIRTGQGFPVEAAISYRDRFAGSNNALDSKYVEARLRLYF